MTTIKFRRDTSANWTSVNPIPAQGEPCYETDTGKLKIGNGSDNYVTLPYVSDGGGSSGDLPIATTTTLGGVKVGDNLSITGDGKLSASSEAKTVKTPNGRIILDDGGLHNEDNSRRIISRSHDSREVYVGNSYEPTIISGNSIKLNSTNITDRDGNTFLSGDTIKGVKFFQDSAANKNIANSGYTNNRLELTANACNLYDSDNRNVFGSEYDSGHYRTNWFFASQSDTVRIAKTSASNDIGLMLKVPADGASPTIGYTYYGTDSSLYGKKQTFLRTEDVDNSTIKIVDGKLTASGGGSAPTNMVTTDTDQTISGSKTFSAQSNFNNGCRFNSSSYSANYFKKGFTIGNVNIYNTTGNTIRIDGSSTRYLTFNDNNIKFMSNSSTPGMNITDGVITAAYDKPYLKIKEYNDNTNTHNLEISCDTTNNNSWNIACGDQTFINTSNIDTTYMKWDSTNKKLKVDTAAVAHLAMPSDKYIDLILGASGTTYTAPADGWFCFVSGSTTASGQYCRLINTGAANPRQSAFSSGPNQYVELLLPVSKEDGVDVHYTAPVATFRFIYTIGEQ